MSSSTYIIAEAGVNHNGSLQLAKDLVDAATYAGADAVKFQTFNASASVARSARKALYQKGLTSEKESHYEMSKRLELSREDHETIIEHCKSSGITFLSSPFDLVSAQMLHRNFNLEPIKIPSGEITNAPLLYYLGQTRKALILSTGMSSLGDIEAALGVLAYGYCRGKSPSLPNFREAYDSTEGLGWLKQYVTLLHCVSEYPAASGDVHLQVMDTLQQAFQLPVGLSDHTLGIAVPIAAVARGAAVLEKHFTLDKDMEGPDHKASLDPEELKEMVTSIREVESALGEKLKRITQGERANREVVRKSLVAAKSIKKGELLSSENLGCKRPGTGISPLLYWEYEGKVAKRNYQEDEAID
ncbi:N-acetylneuraminate synthase [Halobacillus halophilus]|uniref:N-acetylneuraminate synthase n=1 Tax=Halobacillus halophilus TaxID=1570 RepID=UPI001CD7BDED|nr:N-acetylneuraminate synthase [Halobacillus halophilus]MCA1012697.1 N-acetylneuraminate synthase [Halobacillus halophilus]